MVSKFLDKNEVPKETIALEYIYARRTRGNVSAFVFEQHGVSNLSYSEEQRRLSHLGTRRRHQARSVASGSARQGKHRVRCPEERCSGNLNQSRFLCRSASVVLTLDLTRPNEMWVAMESLLENASRCTDVAIKALDQKSQAAIKSRMAARCSEYKVDPHSMH